MTKQKALLGVLLVSVALNLVFLGMGVNRWLHKEEFHRPLEWAMSDLSDQARAEIRPLLERQRDEMRGLRGEMRTLRGNVKAAIEAEPFDPVRMEQALSALRDVSARYQSSMHHSAMDVMSRLDREQRMRVARLLIHHGPDGRPPRKDGYNHEHPPRPGDLRPAPSPPGDAPEE